MGVTEAVKRRQRGRRLCGELRNHFLWMPTLYVEWEGNTVDAVWAWHGSLFAHLREIPTTGEVEYHDGRGNVWRFYPKGGGEPEENDPDGAFWAVGGAFDSDLIGSYFAPKGLYLQLDKLGGGLGWRMLGRSGDWTLFDTDGRLEEIFLPDGSKMVLCYTNINRGECAEHRSGSTFRLSLPNVLAAIHLVEGADPGTQDPLDGGYDRIVDSATYEVGSNLPLTSADGNNRVREFAVPAAGATKPGGFTAEGVGADVAFDSFGRVDAVDGPATKTPPVSARRRRAPATPITMATAARHRVCCMSARSGMSARHECQVRSSKLAAKCKLS